MDYPKSVANVGLVNGKFIDEDTTTGAVGSLIPAQWGNSITDEILAVISAAGLTPSEDNNAQLLAALRAINQKQMGAVTGGVRNARLLVTTAAASTTFTADEVCVKSGLGSTSWMLSGFNKAINLSTVGAGGMDAGSAPTIGFVGLYAIYNPSTGANALLAVNAVTSVLPAIYSGENMPSGYTASALVSVLPTTSAGLFAPCQQTDNKVDITNVLALTTATPAGTTPITIAVTAFPKNARLVSGSTTVTSTAASGMSITLYASDAAVGRAINNGTVTASGQQTVPFSRVAVRTPQTLRYASANGAGSPTFVIEISSYEI